MKIKKKTHFLLIFSIISFFLIKGIYGYLIKFTDPQINKFSILQTGSYTVRHELMNLDGTTYTLHQESNYNNIPIGTTVTPDVLNIEGFNTPTKQTIVIDSYNNTIITYQYPRKQYTLTITDSNNVTTTTPSGTYYYGQEIHLTANSTNNQGSPFIKWSNNKTEIDYTFSLTKDTTIGPIYAGSYQVTFEPNNNESQIIRTVIENQPIGTLPNVTYDDCESGTGSYLERNCTYVYEFKGWYKEPTFETKVDETFVPTEDITLYAKWNKIFFSKPGDTVFDGSNYVNTGIQMFNEENGDKDFIVTFTVDTNDGYQNDRGTIFADMNEKGEPYPGVHFFYQNNKYVMNINTQGNKQKKDNTGYVTGQKIVIKKENGIVSYSYDNGPFTTINDFSNFSTYFNNYATFGAGTNSSGNMYRYFKGTITDMSVELKDYPSYTIIFDANGASGIMEKQKVGVGKTTSLNANKFINEDSSFGGWNTEPDGSGTSYANKASITNLGNDGDEITLYAQWIPQIHYYIHFDANGGTGTMTDQRFAYNGIPSQLKANEYIKVGYVFKNWNTEPDGSGTSYEDEESIVDLSNIEGDVITLYAQYMKIKYNYNGDKVFDGTANTFVDTGVNLYTEDTIDKDFEIRFTVKASSNNNTFQATIINCKDESNPKWPGFNIRFNDSANMTPLYKWNNASSSTTLSKIPITNLPVEFVYKRINGIVTLSYSYDNKQSNHTLYNQSDWTLTKYFDDNISFGGIYNSDHLPDRFFVGTLSDIIITADE